MSGAGAYSKPYALTNDLCHFAQRNIQQIAAIGGNERINVLVFFDIQKKVKSSTPQPSLSQEQLSEVSEEPKQELKEVKE